MGKKAEEEQQEKTSRSARQPQEPAILASGFLLLAAVLFAHIESLPYVFEEINLDRVAARKLS